MPFSSVIHRRIGILYNSEKRTGPLRLFSKTVPLVRPNDNLDSNKYP